MRQKVWIVTSIQKGFTARPAEHTTLDDATKEASRLTNLNPTDTFLIYELVRSVKVQNILVEDITIEPADTDDDEDEDDGYTRTAYYGPGDVKG